MKKQLDALSEFLDNQFSDWSDIDYDYNDIYPNSDGTLTVTVQVNLNDTCFTHNFEVGADCEINIEVGESGMESADSKWFWIMIAPQLFPRH